VQVTCPAGASDVAPAGQVMAGAGPVPEKTVSLTVMGARVTLPVLVTAKL